MCFGRIDNSVSEKFDPAQNTWPPFVLSCSKCGRGFRICNNLSKREAVRCTWFAPAGHNRIDAYWRCQFWIHSHSGRLGLLWLLRKTYTASAIAAVCNVSINSLHNKYQYDHNQRRYSSLPGVCLCISHPLSASIFYKCLIKSWWCMRVLFQLVLQSSFSMLVLSCSDPFDGCSNRKADSH